jgi:hypothetical protein
MDNMVMEDNEDQIIAKATAKAKATAAYKEAMLIGDSELRPCHMKIRTGGSGKGAAGRQM